MTYNETYGDPVTFIRNSDNSKKIVTSFALIEKLRADDDYEEMKSINISGEKKKTKKGKK